LTKSHLPLWIAIVGPTGVGKTEVAFQVARRLPCDIVVVDSMQVYRGMEVGTSKPPLWMRQTIPHHGLDLVEPEEVFDAAQYVRTMRPILDAVSAAGRIPVLVGGCGLYLRAILDGICQAPGCDLALRKALQAEEDLAGPGTLYAQLKKVDPRSAARIHPHDLRRVIRALEVYRLTGKPLSVWQSETTQANALVGKIRLRMWGLTCERKRLYRRIEARADAWLESGWLDEARTLIQRPLSHTARQALGYRELFAYIEGRWDWDRTRWMIHRNTRRYAKRQWAWFRADRRVNWIALDAIQIDEVVDRVVHDADRWLS